MATNTVGIDKEVEVNRKENLRNHRLYWIGRRTQDVILSSLALVVLSPVMLATAIAIVVDRSFLLSFWGCFTSSSAHSL